MKKPAASPNSTHELSQKPFCGIATLSFSTARALAHRRKQQGKRSHDHAVHRQSSLAAPIPAAICWRDIAPPNPARQSPRCRSARAAQEPSSPALIEVGSTLHNRAVLRFAREVEVMRHCVVATVALACVALGTAPLNAQQAEEIILANPAFSLTFSAGYIADDLELWQKHGIKREDRRDHRHRRDQLGDLRQLAFRASLRELVRPRHRARPEADRDRHHHRSAVRAAHPAQGHREGRGLRSEGAAGKARGAAQGPHRRGRFDQLDDPRLCAAAWRRAPA